MRIGIFDSGLGGLVIHKAVTDLLPQYDTVYLGDTLHVPYGGRSHDAILSFTEKCVDYLFREHDCHLIIIACNTASTTALRQIQQQYLPAHYPNRRVLGVVIPTVEACIASGHTRIGLLATQHSVRSNVYAQELQKINPNAEIIPQAAPLLVPMIENDGIRWIKPVLETYLAPLIAAGIQSLVLGCTHYPVLKNEIRALLPADVQLVSQDEIIPQKIGDYLRRHPEHDAKLSRGGTHRYLVTDYSENYEDTARALVGGSADRFEKVIVG